MGRLQSITFKSAAADSYQKSSKAKFRVISATDTLETILFHPRYSFDLGFMVEQVKKPKITAGLFLLAQ